jgi:hypothetical protein
MKILFPLALLLVSCACQHDTRAMADTPAVRFATYNSSLYSEKDGGLIARLEAGDDKAASIAAVIQHQRPDVLLLNEFDYDPAQRAADIFQHRYLEVPQHGQAAISYPYRYLAPVNTGVPSGMDLDRNGKVSGGNDAYGFGLHPGQYGMLVLSRYPIDLDSVRTFQMFLWKDLPGAKSPMDPASGDAWYPADVWNRLRLSSKSHWDVPVRTPAGLVHFLVHHPTPPVFDGPEDRNGIRNRDEIRLWSEYISDRPAPWLCDDAGRCGGLPGDALFVVAGDHNADPMDGDSTGKPMAALLEHPRVLRVDPPASKGAEAAALRVGGGNLTQKGIAAHDTGDFGPRIGNLRLDYVIPSQGFVVRGSGVFWPMPGETGADWIEATDHHMVWMDLAR